MSTDLAVIESQEIQAPESISTDVYLAPALSVKAAVERQIYLQHVVSKMLVPYTKDSKSFDGADYGVLPGTSTRTLFQPGAEKLAMFFGLQVDLSRQQATEDWDKGFFFYRYKATVYYKKQEVCNIERSCHTREDKYAWVWVESLKPPKDVEDQMKAEKTGRNRQVTKWEGGRSSKVWVWQERRPNPDTYSLQFVVEAMAQKRAYVAAVKKALGATGFFAKEIDAEAFRDEMPTEPERPVKLVGGQPKPAPTIEVGEEEERLDKALKQHCTAVKKTTPLARQLWQEKYEKLSIEEKRAAVENLGKMAEDALDAEVVEEESAESLIEQIEGEIFKDLGALGVEPKAIIEKIASIADGEIGLEDLNADQLRAVRNGLKLWRDSLRKDLKRKAVK